jgi:hypothetical protein
VPWPKKAILDLKNHMAANDLSAALKWVDPDSDLQLQKVVAWFDMDDYLWCHQ